MSSYEPKSYIEKQIDTQLAEQQKSKQLPSMTREQLKLLCWAVPGLIEPWGVLTTDNSINYNGTTVSIID